VPGSAYLDLAVVYLNRITQTWMNANSGPCGRINHNVRSCGYPADKGREQMWCSEGRTDANDLCDQTNDALRSSSVFVSGGMSGGPVMVGDTIRAINSGKSPSTSIFAPVDVITSGLFTRSSSIYSSTCKCL
jgi:V8-like Glu-specific endopeptidase